MLRNRLQRVMTAAPKRFARDRRGAIAIEFAILLPVLMVFYLGTFEAGQAIGANRKLQATASTVDDLVARSTVMSQTRFDNILDISSAIMAPFNVEALTLTVTALKVKERPDGSLEGRVHWSRSRGGTAREADSVVPVPSALRELGEGYLVMTEASYRHAALFNYLGAFDGLTFKKDYVFRPRKSTEIPWQ